MTGNALLVNLTYRDAGLWWNEATDVAHSDVARGYRLPLQTLDAYVLLRTLPMGLETRNRPYQLPEGTALAMIVRPSQGPHDGRRVVYAPLTTVRAYLERKHAELAAKNPIPSRALHPFRLRRLDEAQAARPIDRLLDACECAIRMRHSPTMRAYYVARIEKQLRGFGRKGARALPADVQVLVDRALTGAP